MDCSRCSVELSSFLFVDKVLVFGWCGVDGSGFKDGGGDVVGERVVDNVIMFGNLFDIGYIGELVIWVSVKDVFEGKGGVEEVIIGVVDDIFGFIGGIRGLWSVSFKIVLEVRK